jgi:protein-L-isoaspartate(D-aspartate) O-methyltransferase
MTAGQRPPPARDAGPSLLRPQRLLDQAARDAARLKAPSGHGLDSEAVRARMVVRLRAQGVECERVLQAMSGVPRHLFVDTALAAQAYEDTSLPIGWGQTISKPSVVARMLSLLTASPSVGQRPVRAPLGRALEIGTGCGYQAAVLARLATHLTSIERLAGLHQLAMQRLQAQGQPGGIRLLHADGRLGHPPNAPYDSIISAAGGLELPQAWLDQLAMGGRLVAPVELDPQDARRRQGQSSGQFLVVIDRTPEGLQRSIHEAVHFVPLESGRV